jgi:3'-phosphoadenosine 5'-phosphosulfate sulfotransferase (PAPS reductase)/FAD synthetase
MVFCHGHLTANDIYRLSNGSFVVLSNLFWSHRPQWYDLAFNIWNCLMHIRDTNYTFEQMLEYIERWLATYRAIPVVQQDKDFERKIAVLLLERTMGAILVDLGANDFYEQEENKPHFQHLLNLHQRLFNYLAQKLETA